MLKVSVVIPTYNAIGQIEPLLGQLQALCKGGDLPRPEVGQVPTTTGCEVVIADDASPDGTASQLAEQYPWLRVVAGEKNVGFGANVMRGVQAATGEYLFLLNSDVELCGDPITPLVEVLEQ